MIEIVRAGPMDIDALLMLLSEMAAHYDQSEIFDAKRARVNATPLLDGSTGRYVLLARRHMQMVGFGTLYSMFPGESMQSQWYVKELFVSQSSRGLGIGEAILRHAAGIVSTEGGTRLDLVADAANLQAQAFYERLGARAVPRVYYRYDGLALSALAAD